MEVEAKVEVMSLLLRSMNWVSSSLSRFRRNLYLSDHLLLTVTPLDTKYALLDPQLRSQAKRDALGLPAEKPTQKNKAKPTTNATKDVVKKKPSKEPVKEKPPKSLPEALKQVIYKPYGI